MTLLHFKFPCVAVSVTCSWFAHASWVTYDTCVVSFFFFFVFSFGLMLNALFISLLKYLQNLILCVAMNTQRFGSPFFFPLRVV